MENLSPLLASWTSEVCGSRLPRHIGHDCSISVFDAVMRDLSSLRVKASITQANFGVRVRAQMCAALRVDGSNQRILPALANFHISKTVNIAFVLCGWQQSRDKLRLVAW